jgi:hypothetical protein
MYAFLDLPAVDMTDVKGFYDIQIDVTLEDFNRIIWCDDGRYWPVIISWRKGSMDDAFCAIKSAPQKESIDAALIAQSDVKNLIAWSAPPRTSSEVRKLMSKTGYTIRPKLDPEDVTPVDAVLLEFKEDEDGMEMFFSADEAIERRTNWPSRPFMVAGIWHDLDRYWPVFLNRRIPRKV